MEKRLYRSRTDRVLAGVCGGLASYLKLDPTLIRIAVALLAIFSAGTWVVLLYLVMAIIVPLEPEQP